MERIVVKNREVLAGGKVYRCAIGASGVTANKREGDGKTPLGVFPFRECWYRADRMSAPVTPLPLRIIRPDDGWCDDPAHVLYNKHFKISPTTPETPSPYRGEGWGGGARLTTLARKLRTNMTHAEKILWRTLRHEQLGVRFRRQHPFGRRYVLDFVCLEKKMVIEVDGGQHAENNKNDITRDAFLLAEGYRVLRFWNNDVLQNIEGVTQRIAEALGTPTPALPPAGGGSIPRSFEHLWRKDHVYDIVIPLGYNDGPIIPGHGSAIFMHLARPNYEGTEGCVALAVEDLLELLPLLSPQTQIEIIP